MVSLRLDTTNYVSNELNEFFEMLFMIVIILPMKKRKKIKISLVFEYKSYVENFIHLQI